jgi:BirA family biotin operon repressor/biotin-[acetyl-CoA-carboxylase] ligase
MNWVVRNLAVTESTNDDAKKAAEGGEPEGLVIWALRQTAGRGRHGRNWESPEGNLYCSLLLRPVCETKDFSQYAFVAALALYDVVKALAPKAGITLKWPNDVLADGKKISGVLLESGPGWLVAGMGLNILNHPEGGLYPATSLQALGVQTDPKTALDKLLERIVHWQAILQKDGFTPIRGAWLERAGQGRMMVKLPQGTVEGLFAGLAADGALRLKLADGSERAIATGDVFPATGS